MSPGRRPRAGSERENARSMPASMPKERRPVPPPSSANAGRNVFLVHGRDHSARDAVIALLDAFGLNVINWRDAAAHAGGGTPYTGDIVAAGMELADAVVILLTPDDVGHVRSDFAEVTDGPHERHPTGQARLNVVFEAGMAMAGDRDRVVLVEIGQVRKLSDIDGLNVIRMNDDIECRMDLAQRLDSAGLSVDTDGEGWKTAGRFTREPLNAVDLKPVIGRAAPIGVMDQDEAEYRVLSYIAEHFAKPDARRLNTPFAVPDMTWEQVATILRGLAESDPPYVTGIGAGQLGYPVIVTGLTERGRRRLRQASGPPVGPSVGTPH
jgi:predicted nucleotide-binding protein